MNKLLIIKCSDLRKAPNIKSTETLRPLEILYVLHQNLAVLKKKKGLIFDTVSIFLCTGSNILTKQQNQSENAFDNTTICNIYLECKHSRLIQN